MSVKIKVKQHFTHAIQTEKRLILWKRHITPRVIKRTMKMFDILTVRKRVRCWLTGVCVCDAWLLFDSMCHLELDWQHFYQSYRYCYQYPLPWQPLSVSLTHQYCSLWSCFCSHHDAYSWQNRDLLFSRNFHSNRLASSCRLFAKYFAHGLWV